MNAVMQAMKQIYVRFLSQPLIGRGLFPSLALGVTFAICGSVGAQQVTADAIGRVTDPSGAIVPGAQVAITNAGTHEVRRTTTDSQGEFTFNLLQLGSYTVQVDVAGFKTVAIPPFALSVGERRRLDVQMQVGAQTEQVVVTSEAPALQTDSASLGQTLENQSVQDLPT